MKPAASQHLVMIYQPHQASCTCGWLGSATYLRGVAVDEARSHEMTHEVEAINGCHPADSAGGTSKTAT